MANDLWSRIRNVLRREARDIQHSINEATQRATDALDAKERELAASPEERLATEQERAEEAGDAFEQLKQRIEREGT